MNIPENLKYTKDHEWIKIDSDIATIGITSFAPHSDQVNHKYYL